MATVVIYATIFVAGIVSVIEYKGDTFRTNEDCITYLEEYNNHINETLNDHLNKKEKGASVLFIGCSERGKFFNPDEQTT
tara:strand:+ start:350 stop:589 length:240 start_codon:yes stop_codon:yes gene_type:complete